ncbi:hypothetical protein [Geomesophilobacter sediminis]|uniref:DUF4852 domain-containing protein n=1 Tax=Geomesophilobacter sediminis TaxID=2798584 RepID=A0A8J7S7P9_9BACT|nr:hypothetical protein [Geomesophilobacter sediminis]MBJ6727151.1 hypothetical protein [Geomesophilobacter sediminis]
MRIRMPAASIVAMIALLLSGCGAQQISKELYTQKRLGQFELHASLEKGSNGYRFTQLSTKRFHLQGTHVCLNDLSPEDLDVTSYSCLDRFFGLVNAGNCPQSGKDRFRSKSVLVGDTVGMHLFYVGLLTVFGVVPVVHESHFDYQDYNAAVSAALKQDHLDRDHLLDELDDGITYCNELGRDLQTYGRKKYDEEHYYATALYNKFRERIQLVEKVRDSSGFYDNSIAMMEKVALAPNDVPIKRIEAFAYPLELSCPPSQFTQELERKKQACNASFAEDKREIDRNATEYGNYLSQLTSYITLRHPREFTQNDYHIKVFAPDTIKCAEKVDEVPVEFEIVSKDFRSIYPRFSDNDNNVEVTFDGRFLTFANKTRKRVKIKSVLFTYNNQTVDLAVNDTEAALELLPGAVITGYDVNPRVSQAIAKLSDYPRLTSSVAKNTTIDFGLAIKYRIVDLNTEKTLAKAQKFNLYDVLKAGS